MAEDVKDLEIKRLKAENARLRQVIEFIRLVAGPVVSNVEKHVADGAICFYEEQGEDK